MFDLIAKFKRIFAPSLFSRLSTSLPKKGVNRPTVLLVSSNSSAKGGGERYLYYLARGFLLRGYACYTLYSDLAYMDCWSDLLSNAGSSVIRKPLHPLSKRKLRFVSAILDLLQIIRISLVVHSLSPSLVVVNRQYDEDNLDAILASVLGLAHNIISVVHMPMTAGKNKRPIGVVRGLFVHIFSLLFLHDHVFSSRAGLEEFSSYYNLIPAKLLHVVPSGVFEHSSPSSVPQPDKHDWSFNNDLPCVGFMGQFNAQKNITLLIDAWKYSNFPFNLVLIGHGPLEASIRQYVAESGNSNYRFLGWSDQYQKFLFSLDLFVMTSLFEGLPLTLVEALGLGIPSIVTPFNGSDELSVYCEWLKVCKNFALDSFSLELERYLSHAWRPKVLPSDAYAFRSLFSVTNMSASFLRCID